MAAISNSSSSRPNEDYGRDINAVAQTFSTSAVARCLKIPELQQMILEILHDESGLAILAVLVRTARCFQELALDKLWGHQTSLVPLIQCLPPHLWTNVRWPGTRAVELLGDPRPEDWIRVKFYASRIRTLSPKLDSNSPITGGNRKESVLSPDVFITLRNALGSEPFLPNLDSFRWEQNTGGEEEYDLAAFLIMLNPRVSSMDVVMTGWSTNAERTIASTLNAYRNPLQFRSIKFECPGSLRIQKAVLDLGARQHQLRCLQCAWDIAMPLGPLNHFLSIHQLEQISIRVDRRTTLALMKSTDTRPFTFFPFLRILSLHTDTLDLCHQLLGIVQSSALEDLSIVVNRPPLAATALQGFFSGLIENNDLRDRLEKLRFVSKTPCERGAPGQVVTTETLEPLLSLSLIALQLEPGMPFDIDNDLMQRMADAWPSISTLELGAEWRRYEPRPRITLRSLVSLVRRCKDLTQLALTFDPDARTSEAQPDGPTDQDPSNANRRFVLGVGASWSEYKPSSLGIPCDDVQTAWDRAGKITRPGQWDVERGGSASWRGFITRRTEFNFERDFAAWFSPSP
ncbi:hypothetical protein C8Q70DRAFT_973446 [Cubamyces menziesii]|nr:hypothetical protein C8Q70DRAFT_973446 [Cubamyces menziesii]